MASIVDTLLSGQLLFAALVTGSLYALVALGLNLVYGTLRMLNVAHGDVVMLGAYGAYWAFSVAGVSPLVAAPAVAALGALAGLAALPRPVAAAASPRPAPARPRLEGNSLLLFFGLSIILQNAAALAFTPNARGLRLLDRGLPPRQRGDDRQPARGARRRRRDLHRRRGAARPQPAGPVDARRDRAARGRDHRRHRRRPGPGDQLRASASRTAALAGALVSMLEQISPFTGFPFTIAAFIVIILGGLGNLFAGLGRRAPARRARDLRRRADLGEHALGAALRRLRRARCCCSRKGLFARRARAA